MTNAGGIMPAVMQRHLAYCKATHHVRFVDASPMTVTGKAQKYLMREATVAEPGL